MLDPDPDEINADPQPWVKGMGRNLSTKMFCMSCCAGQRNMFPFSSTLSSTEHGRTIMI
jgi:hypothetical protein